MKGRRTIEEKVFSYAGEHHMLAAGDRVVAGVSGGADSVCLLFVLLEYAKKIPLSIAVVHVNHGLRPEAEADARYVEELCRQNDLPFYLEKDDVQKRAAEWKCSREEAGRRVRYEAFTRAAEDFHAEKIAVAHNCNDRSETLLFHLFRGSGLRGLGSIRPVRDCIIRPILCLERQEIEDYLREREIPFCNDATNDEDAYTRNRIRHHILPFVEQEIAPGCVEHMARTAQLLTETEDFLEEQTAAAELACVEGKAPHFRIMVREFLELHGVLQKRVLYSLTRELSPGQKDIGYVHIQDLLTLFTEEGNRTICLPFDIKGRREYDKVFLERSAGMSDREALECLTVSIDPCDKELLAGRTIRREGFFGELRITLLEKNTVKNQEIPEKPYTKWFDYDKIKKSLEIRTRQTGDYLSIADGRGGEGHQSLKDYMITRKIPRQERDRIPVLAEGPHILWLAGHRISEHYKISGNTKHILQVQLSGSCTDSETEDKDGGTCENTVVGRRS